MRRMSTPDLYTASKKASRVGFWTLVVACAVSDVGLWLILPALALLIAGVEVFAVAIVHLFLAGELRKASRGEPAHEVVERAVGEWRHKYDA